MIFYWVRDRIRKKLFPHILGGGKEKSDRLCHKTPPYVVPYSNETQICQSQKKDIENTKYLQTGTRRGCAGTTNPRETRKPDNLPKGI